MKFPGPLGGSQVAGRVVAQQVFGLILQMIEVGIGGEASYRHDELPFVGPRSAFDGQKVSSQNRVVSSKVDFCPFRGPDAPLALGGILARWRARAPAPHNPVGKVGALYSSTDTVISVAGSPPAICWATMRRRASSRIFGKCNPKIAAPPRQATAPMITVTGAPRRSATTPANRAPKGAMPIRLMA